MILLERKKIKIDWTVVLINVGLWGMAILLTLPFIFAQEAPEDLRGSAAGGVNEAFGGTAGAMRGILDGIFGIEQAFVDFFAFLKGTFLGDWGE